MRPSSVVVLFLLLYASWASAKDQESAICIPPENNGKQIVILMQGKVPPDMLAGLELLIQKQVVAANAGKESIRITVIRDGVCIPIE